MKAEKIAAQMIEDHLKQRRTKEAKKRFEAWLCCDEIERIFAEQEKLDREEGGRNDCDNRVLRSF